MSFLFLEQWSSSGLVNAIGWMLIHSLWQGLLLMLLATLVIALTRRSRPSLRYNALAALFLLFLAGCCLTFFLVAKPTSEAGRGVAFYDAPTPWGPWTVIRAYDQFAEGTVFFYQLPTRWMAADGSAVLAFSGTDATREWDALNTVRVRFVARPPAP